MARPDGVEQMGELYGIPARRRDGWGIAVYPTKQQSELLNDIHQKTCEQGIYDRDYLKERPAVSIDRHGRERRLTITASSNCQYDMYGNELWVCDTRAREAPRVAEPAQRPAAAAGSAARNADGQARPR